MINSNKYDLNKTRYTHRDYESIKNDLINAIPSLTQEWTSKEESDPGIVLIKLMSMFGDTLSYNIDKIALELYLSSVTQRKNCAKILQLLGYKMHWYRSARVTAHIRLVTETDSQGNPEHIILVPHKTQLVAGNTIYTVVEQGSHSGEIDIYSASQSVPVLVVEGTPSGDVEFNKNDLVNNRYYLPSYQVDESDIRLTCTNNVICEKVDNLYLVTSGDRISYEFNVDEYNRPYIELVSNWKDVAKSEEVTFTLNYIVSSGSQGNISDNAFTTVVNAKGGTTTTNVIITNIASTRPFGEDDKDLDNNNSPGYDPQTVRDAKFDAANYVFTHDTLVTSSDFEKACKRVTGITVSKLVDNQVCINDHLLLEDKKVSSSVWLSGVCHRALDDEFAPVEIEEDDPENPGSTKLVKYFTPNQVILYLAYQNFDVADNMYYTNPYWNSEWNMYLGTQTDPYFADPDVEYHDTLPDTEHDEEAYDLVPRKLGSAIKKFGYYPFKPINNILLAVDDYIKSQKVLNVYVDYGTLKVFPFKVKGTLHLTDQHSPLETLQVIETVNDALTQAYYPSLHDIGQKPDFLELVDIIQNSDVRIKYFDAVGNIVEWAPVVQKWIDRGGDFEENFDTTSAIMYDGLSDEFTLSKKDLRYQMRNVGTPSADVDFGSLINGEGQPKPPSDYGNTAYLWNLTNLRDTNPDEPLDPITIKRGAYPMVQLNSIEELRAFCDDMIFKGFLPLKFITRHSNYFNDKWPDDTTRELQSYLVNNTGLQWTEG